ncbi:hypothetical protein [Baekduia sp.]|uniref:hypothetical protein n=1 Tax=Baekduia sp. TaxID=2600305 RepID=UPI002DF9984E|nr:hypothetical protein [Baekduia sp.]
MPTTKPSISAAPNRAAREPSAASPNELCCQVGGGANPVGGGPDGGGGADGGGGVET